MSAMRKIFSALGVGHGGLCDRFNAAADDLANEAKTLKQNLDVYKKAPDPFAAMLGSMWNNRQWQKFTEQEVDGGNGSGVRNRPIDLAAKAIR